MRGAPLFPKASGMGDVPRQPSRPPRPRVAGRLAAAGGMGGGTVPDRGCGRRAATDRAVNGGRGGNERVVIGGDGGGGER